MPIRMTDDQPEEESSYNNNDGGDWYRLNQQISQNPRQDYGASLNTALGSQLIKGVSYQNSGKGSMGFSTSGKDNDVAACIVEIDKS